jgi:glycosyltransferase A (GT-A) superfamily protein (DUF2064 family)
MTTVPGHAVRRVAVLSRPSGRLPHEVQLAMLEDVYETVAALDLVEPVLALVPPDQPEAELVTWPGTRVVKAERSSDAQETGAVLAALATGMPHSGSSVLVVAGDTPDLPGLLVGKLFRALGSAAVAACPAGNGGLVALAARIPLPPWLGPAGVGLDTDAAVDRLAAAAPRRVDLGLGPGWHRVREPADLSRLDPGLEGWSSTRAALRR